MSRSVAPLGFGRQFARHIHVGSVARRPEPLFGELQPEKPSVVGPQLKTLAAECVLRHTAGHPDFAAARHPTGLLVRHEKPRSLEEVRGQQGARAPRQADCCRIVHIAPPVHPWSTRETNAGRRRARGHHGRRHCNQARSSSFSAAILPVRRSEMSSKLTF